MVGEYSIRACFYSKITYVSILQVGDVFLKNAYFSHNVDDNTVSLAKLV